MLELLKNKSILILGFGLEGQDTLAFLKKNFPKNKIGVADKKEFKKREKDLNYHFGENYLDAIFDYDLIIKSPGIPNYLIEKKSKNKIITSQTDIFLSEKKDCVIGITGTKGKTTTSFALKKVLIDAGVKNVYLVGNVGFPALSLIDKDGLFIYEMSSFQLQNINHSPHIAIILNIFEDHLDQHLDFAEYLNSKKRISEFQTKNDILIYNKESEIIKKLITDSVAKKIKFNPEPTINKTPTYLEPIIKVCNLFSIDKKLVIESLKNFNRLPYRMEKVADYSNISFYNDSAATIPEATIAAIDNLNNLIDTLIVGGVDKGGNYIKLSEKINKSNIKNIILFPETGDKIKKELENKEIYQVESMEEAVKISYQISLKGVLLSPASSSFNLFKNYKDRGDQFNFYLKKYGK